MITIFMNMVHFNSFLNNEFQFLEIEIIHSQGTGKKKINLKNDIYNERTQIENICFIRKDENNQITIKVKIPTNIYHQLIGKQIQWF